MAPYPRTRQYGASRDSTEQQQMREAVKTAHREEEQSEMTSAAILCEANERLRVLSHRLLEVRESERCAIVRDLRDEIGHTLPLITLSLCELGKRPERPDAPPCDQQVADSFQILDQALRQLRALVSDVRGSNA